MAYYYKSLNLHHMWKGRFHRVGGNFAAANQIVGFNNLSNFKRKVFLSRPSPAVLSNKGYCSLSQVVSAIPQSNVLTSSKSENEVVHQDLVKHEGNAVEANNPSNGRVMLIDGTSVIYRAYFKLLAKVHHGHLTHADGNGDWVLTIFSALSFIIDVLGFMPSHAVVVFDHDDRQCCDFEIANVSQKKSQELVLSYLSKYMNPEPYDWKLSCNVAVDWDSVHDFLVSWVPNGKSSVSPNKTVMEKGLNFRHTLYSLYKSNRPPTPDTVFQGLPYLKAAIKAMSVKVIEVPGVEADDVIGTLAVNSVKDGFKVRVVSPDKDFFQILSPSLRLLRIAPRGLEMVSFGMEDFAEKYGGLKPSQFVDVMALMGDKSDNIPGYETTAVSATWCLMLLAANQEWQDRVRAELNMVIQEALRLYPPVAVVSREAFKEMKFGGITIPKGVNVWTMVLTLHTDPEVWGPMHTGSTQIDLQKA
ncbi:5'-3' exonuclease isoform X1 [Populus alba x Populus x berolinensis]|uniref:5'-3' exonuclease isoform X1 n=1 Tax=Populus alba x Populus x berolinensis TaxID=444605 RepID=A0AAD6LZQ7_9ROSI|nr:5'-3' exonuclease isoform X1 [Populus alba x Populus x berolinensis]